MTGLNSFLRDLAKHLTYESIESLYYVSLPSTREGSNPKKLLALPLLHTNDHTHPSKYWTRTMLLNFHDSVLDLTKAVSTALDFTFPHQISVLYIHKN
jgi:hypothetical protein